MNKDKEKLLRWKNYIESGYDEITIFVTFIFLYYYIDILSLFYNLLKTVKYIFLTFLGVFMGVPPRHNY